MREFHLIYLQKKIQYSVPLLSPQRTFCVSIAISVFITEPTIWADSYRLLQIRFSCQILIKAHSCLKLAWDFQVIRYHCAFHCAKPDFCIKFCFQSNLKEIMERGRRKVERKKLMTLNWFWLSKVSCSDVAGGCILRMLLIYLIK